MILNENYTFANGMTIPKLGLGLWMVEDGKAAQVVRDAVEIGYRHFDTAQAYGNERGVGKGVLTCGVPRDKLFVTTKLAAECKSYREAQERIEGSLKALGLDYIDLMIIHSPQPWSQFHSGEHFFEGNLQAWRALEEAHAAGKVRAIGVSNFERVDLDNILVNATVKPMVNQILAHVGNTPFDLIDYTQGKGILVEAYSPVAHGEILNRQDLAPLAEKYGVTIAQLCIRYCIQLGLLPLPKTVNPKHMRATAAVDFQISDADMAALQAENGDMDYGEARIFPVFGEKRHASIPTQER
jgi:diketogulonate reductase-like aldo/keto reductase